MFSRPGMLRARLKWALVAMTAATSVLVGLALWVSDTYIEDAVLRDLMEHELALMIDGADPGRTAIVTAGNLRYFDAQTAPATRRARDLAERLVAREAKTAPDGASAAYAAWQRAHAALARWLGESRAA